MVSVDQPKVIKLMLLVIVLLSFGLAIASFVAVRQCYVSPCFEGDGLDTLWSVNGGDSFQGAVVGLIALVHGFAAYMTLFRASYDEIKYGMLMSFTAVLSIILLTQAVFWGQKATLVDSLDDITYYEQNIACNKLTNVTLCAESSTCGWTPFGLCQRAMTVNKGAKTRFNAATAMSVLLALVNAAFTYLLLSWKEEFGQIYAPPRTNANATSSAYAPRPVSVVQSRVTPASNANEFGDDASTSYQAENVGL